MEGDMQENYDKFFDEVIKPKVGSPMTNVILATSVAMVMATEVQPTLVLQQSFGPNGRASLRR
jgi:hypothetical protein